MGDHKFYLADGTEKHLCEECGTWYGKGESCKCILDALEKIARNSMFGG